MEHDDPCPLWENDPMFQPDPFFATPVPVSRAVGCLLGGAIGDALGRPLEGINPPKQCPDHYVPWAGWKAGPKGTITDDTQLTMALARSLLECAAFDDEDFARRIATMDIRGIGLATRDFVRAWKESGGKRRYSAAQPSAGNGAMMRAAPVGLLSLDTTDSYKMLSHDQASVTHRDALAESSSVVLALAVARLARMERGALDTLDDRIGFVKGIASNIKPDPRYKKTVYRTRKDGTESSLYTRLHDELPELMLRGASLADIQEHFWSGAYVLESGPMAFAAFLASPEDFRCVVREAAGNSRDSDTVAAIAGNLCGAFVGEEGLPGEWLDELEYRDELTGLATGLVTLELSNPELKARYLLDMWNEVGKQFEQQEKACRAYARMINTRDPSVLGPHLADTFRYESQMVLEAMNGKDRYLEYMQAKFDTITAGGSTLVAELAMTSMFGEQYCVILAQDDEWVSTVMFDLADGLITGITMCIIPAPTSCRRLHERPGLEDGV